MNRRTFFSRAAQEAAYKEWVHEEQGDPIMKLPGKVTKVGPKTYRWEPAETLEIDDSKWHPQAKAS